MLWSPHISQEKTHKTQTALRGTQERKMHKQLNNHGIIELQNAIEAIVKDCITDQTIEKAQDMCEQDGGCEISARLTTSGRPEIISADDSWFDVIVDQD